MAHIHIHRPSNESILQEFIVFRLQTVLYEFKFDVKYISLAYVSAVM